MFLLAYTIFCFYIQDNSATSSEVVVGSNKFNCEYNVLQKLIRLEDKTAQQDIKIASLTDELKDAKDTIAELNEAGTNYIRWGRTTCPSTAFLVYEGFVAGAHYTHSGTAVNPLCLPMDPIYDKTTDGFQSAGIIYGAEYDTYSYNAWNYLHDHDIPCAVCRIPRNNVLMVPGKNECPLNYTLEYKGYLMSSHYNHHASEFVCVDDQPEVIPGTRTSHDGKLFYFVEGSCGSLKCDPYKEGWEITCAVCSFSPSSRHTRLQPYN
ncbi:uncharacterized protein LOC123528019 [Mercenaria mercenaria]|uniref:uncharacterized protein LOC123528019 n=1 Tax=Mercenaria mercenaria TaxID=6596 RepID=UPI00234F0F08|nr:uncharacterized protein LOC123528019 [Mercenaria mercenaria]